MDGLAAVSARVQQIEALVGSMQGGARAGRPLGSSTALGTATGTTTATTTTATTTGATTATGYGSTSATTSATGGVSGSSFDAMLEQARSANGTGAAASASARLNADGVPVELARFGNGKVPGGALTSIGVSGHKLWDPAAGSFKALLAEAKAAGVTIGVTDSYRSYDAQVDVARRKGLYSEGGLAAKPGTSDHGWGLSVDLDLNSKAQEWMRANADRFGFVEDVPREPWHWTFTPGS